MNISIATMTTAQMQSPMEHKLEQIVADINANVSVTTLDPPSIVSILDYLGRKYSGAAEGSGFTDLNGRIRYGHELDFHIDAEIKPQDIGLRIVRLQIARDLAARRISARQVQLLMDGLIGWVSYNPDDAHKFRMNVAVDQYIRDFGLRDFTAKAKLVLGHFVEYVQNAQRAQVEAAKRHLAAAESHKVFKGVLYANSLIPVNLLGSLVYRFEGFQRMHRGFEPDMGSYAKFMGYRKSPLSSTQRRT